MRRELLREWEKLMRSVIDGAASVTGGNELPHQLLEQMQRQVELVGDVIDRERRLQRELAARVLAPVDAIFDLLEESGAALRGQAEAMEHAAQALEQTAVLMKSQAELFERTIRTMRGPSRLLASAAGLEPRERGRKAE